MEKTLNLIPIERETYVGQRYLSDADRKRKKELLARKRKEDVISTHMMGLYAIMLIAMFVHAFTV